MGQVLPTELTGRNGDRKCGDRTGGDQRRGHRIEPAEDETVIDANGYFPPSGTSELLFYPMTPCRVRRLVTLVFKVTVMFTGGMLCPFAVGVPPVHLMKMSPVCSASPSTRMLGVTAALKTQCMAPWPKAGAEISTVARMYRE